MRYRLDELGWYQFESLVLGLLKADLGLAIEAWSAPSGDKGRDAYFSGALPFPSRESSEGPFLFQVKFSNASDRVASLTSAVSAEVRAIAKRRARKGWRDPRHYCLITNVSLTTGQREKLTTALAAAIPGGAVHLLCGEDVCASLDRHPQLRRSFPQLLGLADLTSLISDVLQKEHRERSEAAIRQAERYVSTFVPTTAYEKAWSALREHGFAVLCGPPEMGKTTIAWMVAVGQMSAGWEAHLCRHPADFFAAYSADSAQVFVADDAFGRTEYDPSLVSAWERELHLIFPKLDTRHWLIWTSRKHLLERAKQRMDLQSPATRFPDPAAVVVEARQLSEAERAQILYRHAKHHLADAQDRSIVRAHCVPVTRHPAFTPERIRNFVDWLPTAGLADLDGGIVKGKIHEIIENPTDRMRKAYASLHGAHKWVLVALLEERYGAAARDNLRHRYDLQCPDDVKEDFSLVVDQLVDAFIFQTRSRNPTQCSYSWIHPSYRDLVIEELSSDDAIKKQFLSSTDLAGVTLAISGLGGSVGGRNVPLLHDLEDWRRFRARANELAVALDPEAASVMLDQLAESIETESRPPVRQELLATLATVCETLRTQWDAKGTVLRASVLSSYADASRWLERIPPLPNVSPSWTAHLDVCALQAARSADGEWFDPEALSSLVEFVEALKKSEPRWLAKVGFPEKFADLFEQVGSAMESELDADPNLEEVDQIEGRASQLDELASDLRKLAGSGSSFQDQFNSIADRMTARAQRLREELPSEPDHDDDYRSGSASEADIVAMFSDL